MSPCHPCWITATPGEECKEIEWWMKGPGLEVNRSLQLARTSKCEWCWRPVVLHTVATHKNLQDNDPVSGTEVGLLKNWTLNSFPKAVGNYSIKGYEQLKMIS